MDLLWRRVFPGRPEQASQARRFVRLVLAGAPIVEEAELIVSELAGNALRHTRSAPDGFFVVEVTWNATDVRIAVRDDGGSGVPRLGGTEPSPDEEGGRGLVMVAALATRTGYDGSPETGHTVWALLEQRPSAPA
ncbi:ATP-binding protein [Sphaerisporangium flaviroseum]|uniref:ATP-binding protein n=1 Tax=Sphaerisporangium flaviroseum TaxID=509199 RepID=UPI0031E84025